MLPRFQLPDEFRGWRIFCLFACFALIGLGCAAYRLMGHASSLAGMMGATMLMVSLFVASAIAFALAFGGYLARPGTRFLGSIFYPQETLKEPPKDLLFALRMRLRDRYWDAVDQQTRALLQAYGPSPQLYHLRALLDGGRSGTHSAVTTEASRKLSRRSFDRYLELLRRDPPPHEIQTGIEA
jgi:uncharacterized membrane protein YccC